MSDKKVFDSENEVNTVLKYHSDLLEKIHFPDDKELDARINKSEQLLNRLGYELPNKKTSPLKAGTERLWLFKLGMRFILRHPSLWMVNVIYENFSRIKN